MSQEKAQLIAPQGHFTVPGLNVAGVVTASSFSGNCTGTASSIAQGTNVVVGVMTASSFAGDVFGNAAGLSTTTAGLKLGIVTATSFAGNFTGIGSGLTGTPNIVAGLVTATQFIGNTPGLAGGISAGKNLAAGIVTATTFYGDGSNLTGAGSTAFIRQSVSSATTTLGGDTTNINLNDGNIINFEHVGSPTLSFFNAKTADDITIIRPLTDPTNHSFDDGAVDFDGSGDYLSLANDSDLQPGSGDFTFEAWIYPDSWDSGAYDGIYVTGATDGIWLGNSAGNWIVRAYGVTDYISVTNIPTGQWSHVAVTRSGSTLRLFFDGVLQSSVSNTKDFSASSTQTIGSDGSGADFDGKISNLRFVKGTAVYTSNFSPPTEALTNITNTKLLCCQSDSSTTTAAVTTGTITANGDPTAGSQTITWETSLGTELTWTGVTWNGGSAPTLLGANSYSLAGQVFNLTTADGGSTWYGYEEVNNDEEAPNTAGKLYAWGQNYKGRLGQNQAHNTGHVSSPVQIPGTTWDAVSSAYATFARKSDGTLWSWGENSRGVLGQNSPVNTHLSSPTQIPGTTWSDNFKTFDANAIATKTDGTLWIWGQNNQGQLGLNTPNPSYTSSPTQIPGTTWDTRNQKIAAGYYSHFAIKTNGTLWSWGYTKQGQLGLNQSDAGGGVENISSPTQIGSGTDWKRVGSSWYSNAMAIKTDGTLWSWGLNGYGQLAQNNTTNYSSPIQIPGTTWGKLAEGQSIYYANAAIKTDGTLWMWGYNENGELGQNHRDERSSPVQVPGTNWDEVACSTYCTLASKTDGTLWSWGWNNLGQLGHNSVVQVSSPVQIPGTTWTGLLDHVRYGGWALKT